MRSSRRSEELPCSICLRYADEVRGKVSDYSDRRRGLPVKLCRDCESWLRAKLVPIKEEIMERPSWVRCIAKPGHSPMVFGAPTACGRRDQPFLTGLEHAKGCVEQETRVQPCPECVAELEEK